MNQISIYCSKRQFTLQFILICVLILTIIFGYSGCSAINTSADNRWRYEFNSITLDTMKTYYYWHDSIPANAAAADMDVYSFVNGLLYDLDKERGYTYFWDTESYEKTTSGEMPNPIHGIEMVHLENSGYYISLVFPDSKARERGIKRGYRILEINGNSVSSGSQSPSALLAEKSTNTIKFEKPDGTEFLVENLEKSYLDIPYVMPLEDEYGELHEVKVFEENNSSGERIKIGYMNYLTFLHNGPSVDNEDSKLQSAIQYFNTEDVDELILDLRYNGGGALRNAQFLLSVLVIESELSTDTELKPAMYLKGNSLIIYPFYKQSGSDTFNLDYYKVKNLGLDRIFILTTKNSASASESLINSLKPFMDVHHIGTRTHGKPVAQSVLSTHAKYGKKFLLVTNGVFNANGLESGFNKSLLYFDGIAPEYEISEFRNEEVGSRVMHVLDAFGSMEDPLINAALEYIRHGEYPDKNVSTASSFALSAADFEVGDVEYYSEYEVPKSLLIEP